MSQDNVTFEPSCNGYRRIVISGVSQYTTYHGGKDLSGIVELLLQIQSEVRELKIAVQENRDQIEALLGMKRMGEIDSNKEKYADDLQKGT